jgi:hypothetical protein
VPAGLTQEQIALVLRRAAELDRDLASPWHGDVLDAAVVEQAAVEAGLSSLAVRRALAELEAGMLDAPVRRYRGVLGPPTVTISRTVPGPPAAVEERLHRFLHEQLFELRRDMGSRTTWIRRRGLEATARRAIDRAGRHRLILREVNHVDLSVLDHDEDWVVVHLDVDVLSVRHTQGTLAGSATVVGGGVAVGGAAAAGLHPVLLLAVGAGAGLMSLGHWAGASLYRRQVGEMEAGLAGVLDRIERGERRAIGGRPHGS